MTKQLKDILKQAHDKIKGVHASQTGAASTGKDPGVDYDPKAGDEHDFIAKHSVQRWDDPNGNPNPSNATDYVMNKAKEAKHGNTEDEAKASYFRAVKEAKEVEEAKCNMSGAGAMCPVHEMKDCTKMAKINEVSDSAKKVLGDVAKKHGGKVPFKSTTYKDGKKTVTHGYNDTKGNRVVTHTTNEDAEKVDEASRLDIMKTTAKKSAAKAGVTTTPTKKDFSKLPVKRQDAINNMLRRGATTSDAYHKTIHMGEEVEQVDEVLTKSDPASKWIHDFVHSDNPKFKGKSKEERKKQALGAYYAKQRNEETVAECGYPVQPLVGGDQPQQPRGDSDEAASMVRTELKALANKATHLTMNMPQGMHIEPWIQAKIAQAKEMVSAVHDYMIYGDHENESTPDTTGGGGGSAGGALVMNGPMDTPMTFPNMSVDVNTGQNV